MNVCPPTVSTHQAGADIAEDNWFIKCHCVSNLAGIVNAPLSTLRNGEIKSSYNGTSSTVKLNDLLQQE